jgi:hypothetical protein
MSERQLKLTATLAAAVVFCLGSMTGAERVVEHGSPTAPATNSIPVTARQQLLAPQPHLDDAAVRLVAKPTSGDRWESFEAEFGLANKNPSLVLGSIQNAKYQLDRATFAIQQFTQNVESVLKFDYGIADLVGAAPRRQGRPTTAGSIFRDSLDQVRIKSDIRLNALGESYIGVKLEMPFGN